MIQNLKNVYFFLNDLLNLTLGIFKYLINRNVPYFKRTSQKTNIALVNMFCKTNGLSNDLMSFFISKFSPPVSFSTQEGILGELNLDKINFIKNKLDQDGFYVFPQKLSENLCDELLKIALNEKLLLRPSDKEIKTSVYYKAFGYYDRNSPQSNRYDLPSNQCINNPIIQSIFSDYSLLSIAMAYLKSKPKLDILGMWWNTNFEPEPQSESAELFHFDMDRPKWLKFFIYLTDVTIDNGPHQFVKGSHRSGFLPKEIRRKGYSRLTDEEVQKYFNKSDIIKHIATKGTIIAEDTRGLHKATKVLKNDRLILQIQYSNSLFGTITPEVFLKKIYDPKLKTIIKNYPEILNLYMPKDKNIKSSLSRNLEFD